MNILLISSIYPEPEEYRIRNDTKAVHYFAKEWVNDGHRVIVLHPYQNAIKLLLSRKISKEIRENVIDGVTVIFGEVQLYIPHTNRPLVFQQKHLAVRMREYLRKKHSDFVPDLVLSHFPMSSFSFAKIFLSKSIKSACILHGIDLRELEGLSNYSRNRMISEIKDSFSTIAYRSNNLKSRAQKIGLSVKEEPIILSGISETLIWDEESVIQKAEKREDFLRVIYAGNLNKQKRVDIILKEIAKYSGNYMLEIIGSGEEEETLKELCRNLQIEDRVRFYGRIPRNQVISHMRKATLFAMVSTNETLGLVYLEAMAQGCIVIGTKGEGIDGIIIDGVNGYLVDPEDDNTLFDKINALQNLSETEIKKIILNGYYTAKKLTDKKVANDYLEKICRLLD